jgi:hypothetical protein
MGRLKVQTRASSVSTSSELESSSLEDDRLDGFALGREGA